MRNPIHWIFVLSACFASACTAHAAAPLTATDREELKKLAEGFIATDERNDRRTFPDLVEPSSLGKLMEEYQAVMRKSKFLGSTEEMKKLYRLKTDRDTLLAEKDPVKFFDNLEPATEDEITKTDISQQLISIAGDQGKAYLVIRKSEKKDKSNEPNLITWPAVRTPKGWRIDVTTFLLAPETPVDVPGEQLLPADEKEITSLASAMLSRNLKDYPRIFDGDDLRDVMEQHRANLNAAYQRHGEYGLRESYTFTPNLRSVMNEKNPEKYFSGFELTPLGMEEQNRMISGIGARIVGVAGDRKHAYVICEEYPEIPDELGPVVSVLRVKYDGKTWHAVPDRKMFSSQTPVR